MEGAGGVNVDIAPNSRVWSKVKSRRHFSASLRQIFSHSLPDMSLYSYHPPPSDCFSFFNTGIDPQAYNISEIMEGAQDYFSHFSPRAIIKTFSDASVKLKEEYNVPSL